MYYGYENYLFFVSTKILQIKCETEATLRNSSSWVSLIGSIARILGVGLKICKTTNLAARKRSKFVNFLKRKSLLEEELMKEEEKSVLLSRSDLSIGRNGAFQTRLNPCNNCFTKAELCGDCISIVSNDSEKVPKKNQNNSSWPMRTSSASVAAAENKKFKGNVEQWCRQRKPIRGESSSKRIKYKNGNGNGFKSTDFDATKIRDILYPEIIGKERLRSKIEACLREGNRLEEDLLATENDRKTLLSDAVVVS